MNSKPAQVFPITTRNIVERTRNIVERLKKFIKSTTPLERLAFACCVYYGGILLIFKILGI